MTQQLGPQFGILEPFNGVNSTDYSERLNSNFVATMVGQVDVDASEAVKRKVDKLLLQSPLSGSKHIEHLNDSVYQS